MIQGVKIFLGWIHYECPSHTNSLPHVCQDPNAGAARKSARCRRGRPYLSFCLARKKKARCQPSSLFACRSVLTHAFCVTMYSMRMMAGIMPSKVGRDVACETSSASMPIDGSPRTTTFARHSSRAFFAADRTAARKNRPRRHRRIRAGTPYPRAGCHSDAASPCGSQSPAASIRVQRSDARNAMRRTRLPQWLASVRGYADAKLSGACDDHAVVDGLQDAHFRKDCSGSLHALKRRHGLFWRIVQGKH